MSGEKIVFIKNRKYINGKFAKKTPEDFKGVVTLGQTFGRWCVVSEEVSITKHGPAALVRCAHKEKYVLINNLFSGKSTGCLSCPDTGLEDYILLRGRWEQIIERCLNPDSKAYSRYGGRGITLSDEFKDCRVFCSYIAALPNKGGNNVHLDRIDNNRGYERGNLRWATPSENNRNKDNLHWVVFNGRKMCLQEFIENHTGLARGAVTRMLKKGISPEIISTLKKGQYIRYTGCGNEYEVCSTRWSDIS